MMRVRSASRSAASALKVIADKNNLLSSCCDVCSSRIKEEINNVYIAVSIVSVFSLEFSVW